MQPDVLRRTRDAAKYLYETHGISCSPHTLRKWRRRGPEDQREHGPEYWVDPLTGHAQYLQSALDRFAELRRTRLTKARNPQLAHLAAQTDAPLNGLREQDDNRKVSQSELADDTISAYAITPPASSSSSRAATTTAVGSQGTPA